MPQQIFCDESGFSGPNLFQQQQEYFIYSSVAISKEEATEICDKIITDYRIQGKELKGKNLVKTDNGRKAIDETINRLSNKVQVVYMLKEFALACKFFEYIIEPLISKKSRFFYEAGFHKFIANFIYFEKKLGEGNDCSLLHGFQKFTRTHDISQYELLFEQKEGAPNLFISELRSFCQIHKDKIVSHYKELNEIPMLLKWLLDLTTTCVFNLLTFWGGQFSQLEVYCDSSKPLQEHPDLFKTMIGRSDKRCINFRGRNVPLTFNLAQEIRVVPSVISPGIQLADVVARAMGYALQNPKEEYGLRWGESLESSVLNECCVVPETDSIDLNSNETLINIQIFFELMRRTENDESLIDGWDLFAKIAYNRMPEMRQRFSK